MRDAPASIVRPQLAEADDRDRLQREAAARSAREKKSRANWQITHDSQKVKKPKEIKISERLLELFGLGEDAARRSSLYARLELLVERCGFKAEAIIREAAVMAESAKGDKGRYFSRTVVLRLRESGVYQW